MAATVGKPPFEQISDPAPGPVAMAKVTLPVSDVTTLPLASSTETVGEVAKLVASGTPPTGWVVKTSFVAAPTEVNRSAVVMGDVPAGVMTVISTVPLTTGEVVVIELAELTVNEAEVVPNLTPVAPVKPVPVMVTEVPPAPGPELGVTPVTVGAYANVSAGPTGEVPLGVVTRTSTVPEPAGEVAVICEAELNVKLAAAVPPKRTPVSPAKPVP